MRKLFKPIIALIILITAMVYPSLVANSATTCFKKGEYIKNYMKKFCVVMLLAIFVSTQSDASVLGR